MSRKAIVHIGPMKTGSTSIQAWLARSREQLLEAGFLFPRSIGAPNMSRLSYMAQVAAAGEKLNDGDVKRLTALRDEIAALPDSVDTVIFSGEMLAHQLKSPDQFQAFKSFLSEFFSEYMIVLYLRRQDELSLSRYSTALRQGFKRAAPLSSALDYEKVMDRWIRAFGRASIRPRIFDRKVMPGGDVVRDFAEAIGLPNIRIGKKPLSQNSSINPEAQAFLAILAERIRQEGFPGIFMEIPGHDVIMRRLNQQFEGKGAQPSRADARAFLTKVSESNERVRAAWFPERASLFSEDFSSYSEDPASPPSAENILEVAISVVTALVTRTAGGTPEDPSTSPPAGRRNIRAKKETRNHRIGRRKLDAKRRTRNQTDEML